MLEIFALGSLHVVRADVRVEVRSALQRAVLIRLIAAEGQPVAAEKLVSDVWGFDSREHSLGTLHVHISGLRRELGVSAIRTIGRTYALGPDVTTDVERFRYEARAGQQALSNDDDVAADALLRSCLSRWRGTPAADIGDQPFVAEFRAGLHELRLSVLEAWAEVLIRNRGAMGIVSELEQLRSEYPFRETLRARLISVLASCGRQADAFAEYNDIRHALADEFGVDPGPELRQAYATLLKNEPVPAASTRRIAVRLGLPSTPLALIGRSRELEELQALVGSARLVTVLGPAGVGKTRLCQELVAMRVNTATFVSLAPAERPEDVPAVIAASVGIETTSDSAADAVIAGFARHPDPLLLVLDNVEHVLPAGPFLDTLLAACPNLSITATSRVPLGLGGERRYLLGGLVQEDHGPRLAAGVALLLERVQENGQRLGDGPEVLANAEAVVRLCDGLPLAIEIAAARTDVYTLAELAVKLQQPLGILTLPGSAGERNSSVRSSILWSLESLSASTLDTLQACAVFHDGCTLSAVSEVVERPPENVVVDLHRLIERSLVRPVAGRTRRFDLLHIVREVVLETIDDARRRSFRDRHLGYYRNRLGPVPDARQFPNTYAELDELATERANLRAATRHAASVSDGLFTDMVVSLVGPWTAFGPIAETRSWLEQLYAMKPVSRERRLDTLLHLLRVTERSGEPLPPEIVAEAWTLASDADTARQGQLIALLAIQALNRQDRDEMTRLTSSLDLLSSETTTPPTKYLILTSLGYIAYDAGDAATAAGYLRRARRACLDGGMEILYLTASHNLSEALMMSGNLQAAADVTVEALPRTNINDGDMRGGLLSNHGTALLLLGAYADAAAALESAVVSLRDSGSTRHALEALMRIGAARIAQAPDDPIGARLTGVYLAAMDELGIRGQMSEVHLLETFLCSVTSAPAGHPLAIARQAGFDLVTDLGPSAALDATITSLQNAD